MPLTDTEVESLRDDLTGLFEEGNDYFLKCIEHLRNSLGDGWVYYSDSNWNRLDGVLQTQAVSIRNRLKVAVLRLIDATKGSPLLSAADETDLRKNMRQMSAALHFRKYFHWQTEVLHDEGTVEFEKQANLRKTRPSMLPRGFFAESYNQVLEILELVSIGAAHRPAISTDASSVRKYRPNTAFIMMWISDEHPELEDVKNTFKEVFKQFGIAALRSDEIEHQDVITARILDEIATSEFLIADLTGERPSVYYEVGYAHALGKRPILFRRKGTPLHFDLAVHNVPEYENLTDLRKKLQSRLSVLTNKELKDLT